MKLFGITRIRNEAHIIKKTLDHVSGFVDGVIVYDDCSTDNTVEICEKHPIVKEVIKGYQWATTPEDRNQAEGELRTIAYHCALSYGADWVYCFDADEFAYLKSKDGLFNSGIDAWRFRLYDFYITKDDVETPWYLRRYMGREYRDILMLFRADPNIIFYQREPNLLPDYKIGLAGDVKHFGKAISVEHWEETCQYYIKNRGGYFLPKFTDKWKSRIGKAIHTQSDFNTPLITWDERDKYGIPLEEDDNQSNNQYL